MIFFSCDNKQKKEIQKKEPYFSIVDDFKSFPVFVFQEISSSSSSVFADSTLKLNGYKFNSEENIYSKNIDHYSITVHFDPRREQLDQLNLLYHFINRATAQFYHQKLVEYFSSLCPKKVENKMIAEFKTKESKTNYSILLILDDDILNIIIEWTNG